MMVIDLGEFLHEEIVESPTVWEIIVAWRYLNFATVICMETFYDSNSRIVIEI